MISIAAAETILLVETTPELCMALERGLRERAYRVHAVTHPAQGLRMVYKLRPDLIIIGDQSSPRVLAACQDVRRFVADVPVLLLTPPEEAVRLRGLTLGADECLYRTMDISDIAQRVDRMLASGTVTNPLHGERLVIDQRLTIDLARRQVVLNRNEQILSPTEARLLSALLKRRGYAVPHNVLISDVWGKKRAKAHMHSLKLYIWYLRQKIEVTPAIPYYILTVRRRGYLFRSAER